MRGGTPQQIWLQILSPIALYLLLKWLLQTGLAMYPGLPADLASWMATLGLSIPVILLYLLRWRTVCRAADTATTDPGITGKRIILWTFLAAALATLSLWCFGANSIAGTAAPLHMLLTAFLATCLLAPVSEEILFRGQFIGRGKAVFPTWLLLFLSTLLFAAAHGIGENLLITIPAGVLLGWLYIKEDRLTGVMAVHCTANILIFLEPYILGQGI